MTRLTRHPLLVQNAACLIVCLLAGYWLYGGRLAGQGDDLANLNPVSWPNEWAFLKWKYLNWGPFGSAISQAPWRLLVRAFDFTPDTFPWWLPTSLSTFFLVATPVNLIAAASAALGWRMFRSSALFIVLSVLAVWTLNDTTFGLTLGPQTTFLSGYTFNFYLVSLVALLLSGPSVSTSYKTWPVLAICYLLPSIGTAIFMFALLPLSVTFITVAAVRQGRPFLGWLKGVACCFALTVIAIGFMRTAPGLQKRMPLLGSTGSRDPRAVLARVPEWYADTVDRAYHTLFGGVMPYPMLLHGGVLLILLAALACLLVGYYGTGARGIGDPVPRCRSLLLLNLMAIGFAIAFHASMTSLLISPYFPSYSTSFSALLLAAALALTVVLVSELAVPTLLSARVVRILAFVSLPVMALCVTWPHVNRIANTYRYEVWLSGVRSGLQRAVVEDHQRTGQSLYRLVDCPPSLEFGVASPLVLRDYFSWRGLPSVATVHEGSGDAAAAPATATATALTCPVPPLYPWGSSEPFTAEPVRTTMHVTSALGGVEVRDFWVSERVKSCTLVGSYNPNVSASAAYRESFHYHLAFGVGHNGRAIARIVQPVRVAGVAWHGTQEKVSIAFVTNGGELSTYAALEEYQRPQTERPLLRVSIIGLHPSWLTSYSTVRLDCSY